MNEVYEFMKQVDVIVLLCSLFIFAFGNKALYHLYYKAEKFAQKDDVTE